MLGQPVVDVQLGDLHLQPLPVRRILDPNGCEVFRGHPRDGGHVVASRPKEVEILLIVKICQPSCENLLIRHSGLQHLLDIQCLDVVRVQAWLDGSSSCEGINSV